MIKCNRMWKIRSLPGYSLASRCTTDRLQVWLRTATFCHGVLRPAHSIAAHYVSHFHCDCRGRFLNCQKIYHGVHSSRGWGKTIVTHFFYEILISLLFNGILAFTYSDKFSYQSNNYFWRYLKMCDLSYLQRKSSRVENYRNLSYDSFPPTVLPRESDYD